MPENSPKSVTDFLKEKKAARDAELKHIALAEKKIQLFLELAYEMSSLAEQAIGKLNTALQTSPITSLRQRVLVGLALKAYGAFECLQKDAKDKRGESAHHLKTIVETFIYMHWVINDATDLNAKLVCAEGYRGLVAYYRNNPDNDGPLDYAAEWQTMLDQKIAGIEEHWKVFKEKNLGKLAEECSLTTHYQRIYRRACEAAHISDLSTYMPPSPSGFVSTAPAAISTLRASISLYYGLEIICDLLAAACEYLGLHAAEQIKQWRERIVAINNLMP
ncbi:MAG: DUF5677 domain-containing protein [Nitrospirales bacterium]|nr:DUF5677 domain-containing protein [Nitrospirales bacterium]